MKKLAMHWQILLAIILATSLGLIFKQIVASVGVESDAVKFIAYTTDTGKFLGNLFMRALKMIIVPLVVSSIIAGLASLAGLDRLKQLGMKTVGFYLLTTFAAASIGLMMVNIVKPGVKDGQANQEIQQAFSGEASAASEMKKERFSDGQQSKAKDWKDIFRRMLPTNILAAGTDNGELLGILVFALIFGITMTRFPPDQMSSLRDFFTSLNEVMIRITHGIMAFAPIGLFGMILDTVVQTGGDFFFEMLPYMGTVIAALAVHMFIVLPLILKFVGGINPLAHFAAMKTALLTAFGTASSSSTLPVTMRCVQENAGVSKRTASFTLPLGATVNMDGTALYECIAVIFVAQVMGFDLSLAAQVGIVFAALLTSIGVAGIPSASMVAILIIMKNSGIPNAEMAVFGLLAVDRLLDMSRTAVNVFGDSCAAVVIGKSEGENIFESNVKSS